MGDARAKLGRLALWMRRPETCYDDDDWVVVNSKVYSAFARVKSFPLKMIIFQFWQSRRADQGGSMLVLECTRSPYAFSTYNSLLCKYRSCCTKCSYGIIVGDTNLPPWIISGSPVETAFVNCFPEVVLDMRVLQRSPLVECGLECDLTCCVMIPVFYGGCAGVVECSMKHPALLLPVFNDLKSKLEREGLSIYHVQGSWPYNKSISGDLEAAKTEIETGLKMACESHVLTLAQAWISYEGDASDTRMLLVKLTGYSDDDPLSSVKDFYDNLAVLSLKKGEGLVSKTLGTHQPHLCRNIYKLNDNKGVLALLSANAKSKCASFVICLRSSHTGDLDYAFEFFWPCSRNHSILPDTLLLTLRKYLPSFKFASGEQLGDHQLSVVDVENSSSSAPVKILSRNDLSEAPKASNETSTSVGVKRKSIAAQSDLNPEGDDDNDDDLAIVASYRKNFVLFYLPSSSTVENVMEKLIMEFELDPARAHKVECEAIPGQWSTLVSLASCVRRMGAIKLRVLGEGREVCWKWRTNG